MARPVPNKRVEGLQLEMKQITRTESILNSNQVQKIFNSTPKKYQYDRPGKAGGTWTFVKASYVRRVLDSVFGFNWDFEVETGLKEAYEVAIATGMCVVKGTITARVKVDGKFIDLRKTQFGRCEVKFRKETRDPLDFGNDMKGAVSDCLKKCASLFGIAADVYEADEFMEIEVVEADDNSKRTKAAEDRLKKAKNVLNQESNKVGGENE